MLKFVHSKSVTSSDSDVVPGKNMPMYHSLSVDNLGSLCERNDLLNYDTIIKILKPRAKNMKDVYFIETDVSGGEN